GGHPRDRHRRPDGDARPRPARRAGRRASEPVALRRERDPPDEARQVGLAMAARIRAWLKREDGMTIPELLTSMAILAFVLTGIMAVFVGGLNATTDMNQRFQAQQDARLALTSLRKEAGSACSESVAAGGASVTLAIPDAVNFCASSTQVTWCASSASGTAPFGLYRQTGTTCSSST